MTNQSRSDAIRAVVAGLFVQMLAVQGTAAPSLLSFESPVRATPLVELYTSEGCSSCPPADQWMSTLKGEKGLWTEFVPIAFHVDYWDQLGWKDPYASAANTERQSVYARRNQMSNMYTPGFFRQGREWRRQNVPKADDIQAGVLSVKQTSGTTFEARFQPAKALEGRGPWIVSSAVLGSGLESSVAAGENRGRKLAHDFVALALKSAPLAKESGAFVAKIELPETLKHKPASVSLAFWVYRDGDPTPVQAVGGDWKSSPYSNGGK